MSAALLSGSNYTMQCLASPSRKKLDIAHAKGDWMEIGVPSVRNLRGQIVRNRTLACLLLAFCSVPIHFLFDSVILQTNTSNFFGAGVASPAFVAQAAAGASLPSQYSVNCNITTYPNGVQVSETTTFTAVGPPNADISYVDFYTGLVTRTPWSPVVNFTASRCAKEMAKFRMAAYNSVLFVTNTTSTEDPDSGFFVRLWRIRVAPQ